MEQFTASEVLAYIRHYPIPGKAEDMLHAFADMLEAREKAVPVGEVVGVAGSYGEMRMIRWRDRYSPAVGTKLHTRSAQAQPPAASVPEVTGLTWEAPDVTINVEQVGRFRSGDEHIVRVTFRSSDDGRRMTCFYSANESAVGYLHAMLAAQENPNG